jgi:sensor histidine kinase YesM
MIQPKNEVGNGESRHIVSYVSRNQHTLVWLGIYLLLIASSARFDLTVAVITATIAIFWMLCLEQLVRRVFIPSLLVPHRQGAYYTVAFTSVCLMVYAITHIDILLLQQLIRHDIITMPEFPSEDRIIENRLIYPIFKNMVLLLGTFTVTTVSHLLSEAQEAAREKERLNNEKLDMELRYLKAQINPHFLFNALNNIYSLVYTNDPNGPESILRLSEMLRYVVDECQTNEIALSKEIKYTENYIDFQLMRMEGEPAVSFTHCIANPELRIPPMLFQPIVENCFKHSRLEHALNGFIRINLTQNENELRFEAENSQSSCIFSKQSERERGGIGIANIRKRLDLAYGDRYTLEIDDNRQTYRTVLTIKLKQ